LRGQGEGEKLTKQHHGGGKEKRTTREKRKFQKNNRWRVKGFFFYWGKKKEGGGEADVNQWKGEMIHELLVKKMERVKLLLQDDRVPWRRVQESPQKETAKKNTRAASAIPPPWTD